MTRVSRRVVEGGSRSFAATPMAVVSRICREGPCAPTRAWSTAKPADGAAVAGTWGGGAA